MRVKALHAWDLTPTEARALQERLRALIVTKGRLTRAKTVAGVDISTSGQRAHSAVVVLRLSDLQPVEAAEADLPLAFPYVPGLLAFREGPAILAALERLQNEPDVLIFDGQGLAHPRRMGIASHMGLILDRPSIGCAKSLLCGEHGPVGPAAGDRSEIRDQGEVIGAALRTRAGCRPVYVSIGHKVDLPTAISCVLRCSSRFRLPEPIRWAHRVAGGSRLPDGIRV